MKMGSAGLNNLILLDQVKGHCGRFSVIPAQTGFVVILGHFFDGPDSSTKFRWKRSKIKGTYTSWHKPKTAKNRGEPQKMTPSSETEIFLGVVLMGKL